MASAASSARPANGASLLLRIIVIFLVSTVIVMGIAFAQFSAVTARLIEDGIRKTALSSTAVEAERIAAPLKFRKTEDIAAVLTTAAEREGPIHVRSVVTDRDGVTVATVGEDEAEDRTAMEALAGEALANAEIAIAENGLLLAAPVLDRDGSPIGALTVRRSAATAIAEARTEIAISMAVAAAIALGLAIGSVLILRQWITRPIVALEARTNALAEGDLEAPVPGLDRRDEIGRISHATEALRHQLSDAQMASHQAIIAGAGFAASSAPLALVDTDFSILQANGAFRREIGTLLDVDGADGEMPTDALSRLPGVDHRDLIGGGLPAIREIRMGDRTLRIAVNAVDRDGVTIAHVVELQDVTAERRDAAMLAALDTTMYRADFDARGILRSANARFEEVFTDLGDTPIWDRATLKDDLDLAQHLATGSAYLGEFELGAQLLSGALAPVGDETGAATGFVLLASDITDERARSDAAEETRKRMEDAQAQIVSELTLALGQLAEGRLTTRIETEFDGAHDRLRQDFNSALKALDQVMVQVLDKAITIKGETDNISTAAGELSTRTEQQAATLEEFAAALTEITESLASAADGASRADEVVTDARRNAEASGDVVREAVSAMSEIAASSERISKIIGVIDDIAFQTNLLALNAGVEAARAGDAGRGFAVVASEVRALAQRSSDAAREINELISDSGSQVKRGVSLVDKTGDALRGIVGSVGEIAELVASIASSAREQSKGLREINTAISQLDQVTQQNVAMFEETTAATRMLSEEADGLTSTTARFTTSGAAALPPSRDKVEAQRASGTLSSTARVRPQAGSNLALSEMPDDDWEEF